LITTLGHAKKIPGKKIHKKPHCFQRALYFLHIFTSPNSFSHKQTNKPQIDEEEEVAAAAAAVRKKLGRKF
jgi:hypothetical protein